MQTGEHSSNSPQHGLALVLPAAGEIATELAPEIQHTLSRLVPAYGGMKPAAAVKALSSQIRRMLTGPFEMDEVEADEILEALKATDLRAHREALLHMAAVLVALQANDLTNLDAS